MLLMRGGLLSQTNIYDIKIFKWEKIIWTRIFTNKYWRDGNVNFDNIIEKRKVKDGIHSLVLEISADEYRKDYDEYEADYALNILERHLENRNDDGRPSDVRIDYDSKNDIVKIFANIHYLGNEHTNYRFE